MRCLKLSHGFCLPYCPCGLLPFCQCTVEITGLSNPFFSLRPPVLSLARGLPTQLVCLNHHPLVQSFKMKHSSFCPCSLYFHHFLCSFINPFFCYIYPFPRDIDFSSFRSSLEIKFKNALSIVSIETIAPRFAFAHPLCL